MSKGGLREKVGLLRGFYEKGRRELLRQVPCVLGDVCYEVEEARVYLKADGRSRGERLMKV